MRWPELMDGGVAVVLLAAAWQGYRRGGIPALAGLTGFVLGWWWVASRAAEGAAWAAGAGVLEAVARFVRPAVARWLAPDLSAAPIRPDTVVRALDDLSALPFSREVEEELADGLRRSLLGDGGGPVTVGEALALGMAGLILRSAWACAVPLAAGMGVAALARRLAAWLPPRLPDRLNRPLGFLAGAVEGALTVAFFLALIRSVAGMWPRQETVAWLDALDRSPVAGRLARWAVAWTLATAGPAVAKQP